MSGPPRDPTATVRQRRCRERLQRHERCASITIGPDVASAMVDMKLLRDTELENPKRLAEASEAALRAWAQDRREFIERLTRDTEGRKRDL